LWGAIGDAAIVGVLAKSDALPQKAAELVDLAKAAGGGDNITLILLHCGE
jgi:serine/threonine protein phosphatase PrpC